MMEIRNSHFKLNKTKRNNSSVKEIHWMEVKVLKSTVFQKTFILRKEDGSS